jgi:hypothetical protein
MPQIPILSGIYTDNGPDFRTSYPVNMVPVPKDTGINIGYLRPADGLVANGTGPGIDRGGIEWRGSMYRVLGSYLCEIDSNGVVTTLGSVGTDGKQVTLDYSFDYLAVASAGGLYLWDGATLQQNTDPDLGTVIDMCWIGGYFMTTDGTSLVVTELNDPFAVNPLKYGSSEADPDPITSVFRLRNEAVAVNRHTIEFFDNIGGNLFPFQRIEGAQIQKGCVGTFACCIYMDTIAFIGGGRNEAPGIYLGANATATKISTREVDTLLLAYTEEELAECRVEARNDRAHQHLYVHLPDRTLVFDAAASQALEGEPVWFVLTAGVEGFSRYPAQNWVWAYNRWNCGNPLAAQIGYADNTIGTQYGATVRWEFGTRISYNESAGALFHSLELVSLPGRVALGESPYISTSYSVDGETWSQSKSISGGTIGQRDKRLVWFQQGHMRNWRVQRFQGDSDAHIAVARLEASLEPLAW